MATLRITTTHTEKRTLTFTYDDFNRLLDGATQLPTTTPEKRQALWTLLTAPRTPLRLPATTSRVDVNGWDEYEEKADERILTALRKHFPKPKK